MKHKQVFYTMVGLLIAVIVGTLVGLYFADSYLESQAQEIADLRAEDQILSEKILSAQTTKANLDKLGFVKDLAREVLPDAKNQSEVILLIGKIADEAGISTETFSFTSTEGDPNDLSQTIPLEGTTGVLVLPITTSFRSNYDQLIGFLEKTEKNKRKMQVSSISINPRLNENGIPTSVLDVQLTINAYVRGQQ